ncbi:diheme cytochrome c [Pseudomonas oligotrophica]|uniref:diheme cytochrome c n=1 Tax=Pseudomonas oligotrophica TaxID=2912055 RepID=UPI001F30D3EA|nr:diheme cytochrome c [Pseudomonas oligotrophica]MCF7201658.1 diheme cytochrome c [Pseudomonas oligotrophica]
MKPIAALATLAGLALAMTLAGFSLADDDEHHGRNGYKRPKRLAVPSGAPLVWKEECAACHMLYTPGLLPADAWREQMRTLGDHYGSNASLDPAQERVILDFLVRASAANRLPMEPSPTAGEPPRISQTRWFERKHDEVSEAKFAREAVGGRFNCVACHRDAEKGDFDEDRVKIPR